MQILIPLRDGHKLKSEVIKSIAMQTVDCDIICVSRAIIDKKEQRKSEAETRNILKTFIKDDFSIFMDSDVCFVNKNDVEDMINAIKSSNKDVLVYNTKYRIKVDLKQQFYNHIAIACSIWRNSFLKNYNFKAFEDMRCLCFDMCKNVNIGYIDDRLLKEVYR